jgi:hypothetical protein
LKKIWFLIYLILIIIISNSVTGENTQVNAKEKWSTILKLSDNDIITPTDYITISIEPNQYYQLNNTSIGISGLVSGDFGPITDAEIQLVKYNFTGLCTNNTLTTDSDGIFSFIDTNYGTGKVRYQALYNLVQNNKTINLSSNLLEIELIEATNIEKENDIINQFDITKNNTNNTSIILTTDTSEFVPGDNVRIVGYVSDKKGNPILYKKVILNVSDTKYPDCKANLIGYTNKSGYINYSYSLSGSDPLLFNLSLSNDSSDNLPTSDNLIISPLPNNFILPVRIVSEKRQVEAYLVNENIMANNSFTIYGWYGGEKNTSESFIPLELVWYNVLEKNWDKYEGNSQILTNKDGLFVINSKAPSISGVYVLAVKFLGHDDISSLYSDVLILSAKNENELSNLPEMIFNSDSDLEFNLKSDKDLIENGDSVQLLIPVKDKNKNNINASLIKFYHSYDGIDWYDISKNDINMSSDLNTNSNNLVYKYTPEKVGYSYIRAILLDEDSNNYIKSNILIIPVLDKK